VTLAFLALAWLLGLAAAAFTGADPAATVAAAGLFGVVSFAQHPRWSTLALIAAASALVFTAGWRYESTVPEPAPIARFNDSEPVRLRGIVSDEHTLGFNSAAGFKRWSHTDVVIGIGSRLELQWFRWPDQPGFHASKGESA